MRKLLLTLNLLATASAPVLAADYFDGDIHKNDETWIQFNLMGAFDELPGESSHDYLEMEFGGRSGIFDLYGYIDIYNLLSDPGSDKADEDGKIYMRFAPRMSLNALIGKDLSFGPVQELYVSTLMEWEGNNSNDSLNTQKVGLGSDVMVPLLGKIGLNLYGTYDSNKKDWDGYQISTDWFKPFYFFENGSFIAYQGFLDYRFGIDDDDKAINSSHGGTMYNGIYWHFDQFALGYGLDVYKDVYGLKDGGLAGKTSGFAHYIAVSYKL